MGQITEPRSAICRSTKHNMGINSKFKWIRAIGGGPLGTQPDFYNYNLPSMRQIPTLAGIVIANNTATPLISAYVPANSWAMNKNLLIRGIYKFTIPPAGMPPLYNVTEAAAITQAAAAAFLTPAAFAPFPGQYWTWIQRNFVRIDPNIHCADLGDVMQFNFANFYDAQAHVLSVPPLVAPFDYSIPIQVDLSFTMPIGPPLCKIECVWCEAFLEQATNLGKLP